MRKHIFVHTSNLKHASQISKDKAFEPMYIYANDGLFKVYRNEFGRIKTDSNYFHIMLGTITDNNCAWCGAMPKLKKLHDYLNEGGMNPERPSSFCMQCSNCGARGPITHVNEPIIEVKEFMKDIEERIKHKYSMRKQWDHVLVNPYEEPK